MPPYFSGLGAYFSGITYDWLVAVATTEGAMADTVGGGNATGGVCDVGAGLGAAEVDAGAGAVVGDVWLVQAAIEISINSPTRQKMANLRGLLANFIVASLLLNYYSWSCIILISKSLPV
jgi:hypothetical protein